MTSNGHIISMQMHNANTCNQSADDIKATKKWKQFCQRNERYIKGSICITIALIIFLALAIHFALKGKTPTMSEREEYNLGVLENKTQTRLLIVDEERTV